jgi:hypothetical protein
LMLKLLHATWSAGFRACSNCGRYGRICGHFRNTRHTVVCGIPSSLSAPRTDFWGLCMKAALTLSTFSSDTRGRSELLPVQRHRVVSNCWYHWRMLLSDGGSVIDVGRPTIQKLPNHPSQVARHKTRYARESP